MAPLHETPDEHLGKLRHWRNRDEPDLSLHFMQSAFRKDIQKPYRQLGAMIEVWTRLLPPELASRTRLESLARGVLRVVVDSSSSFYELDRLLRQGLEQQIIREHKGPAVHKIHLRVGLVVEKRE